MKSILLSCAFWLLFISISVAQTKKTTTKKTKTTKPEIDRLYDKYKNTENVTLYTPYGELNGTVNIQMNDNAKPISVTISGESENEKAINEFISNTIKMKSKQGYKSTDGHYKVYFPTWDFGTSELLLKKGNMYFLVSILFHKDTISIENGEFQTHPSYFTWSIETGDTKRLGGKNATKFEF